MNGEEKCVDKVCNENEEYVDVTPAPGEVAPAPAAEVAPAPADEVARAVARRGTLSESHAIHVHTASLNNFELCFISCRLWLNMFVCLIRARKVE